MQKIISKQFYNTAIKRRHPGMIQCRDEHDYRIQKPNLHQEPLIVLLNKKISRSIAI